ncbi:uncharacterized protein ELE39_002267 [Cryptosporidium sp. chipmunk genotype I]|uniref:uncharacterized protein n=1 Tax=Cryptosporidium sp. chipmunk genotype I TaxID=1280935 RepID=UPI00351A8A6D|nr:hypothetical protein ELE39_002267 [Cryptosporidium sp. chipmunk genotype I]
MNNRHQVEEEEKNQVGAERFDYDKYIYEQKRIEEELDNIEDDQMSRNDLLMNIKMYDDSMKEMEIMKDRLGLWKESLEGLNESIGRDGLYVKEIAIKVVERKVDELMNERKIILKKMVDKLDNFTNVMKTSMECISNSIMDFEKKVYSSGENGDYLSFDFKNNNRICKSYFQLCQRLKEYLRNMSPYFKDNLEVDLGLGLEMNMSAGIGLENQLFEARRSNFKSFECENGELKSIIMEESKLLRDPVILMIDPKRMQTINLKNKINRSDLDEIISSSVTLNSSDDNGFYSKLGNDNPCNLINEARMTNTNNFVSNKGFEQKRDLVRLNSNNTGTNNGKKFEQYQNQEQARNRECGYNSDGNGHIDTDVSISIKRVKNKLVNSGLRGRSRSKSKFGSRSSFKFGSRSSSSSSSRSRSRSKSRTKSRSASEPRITFKKDKEESKMNKIRGLVSELELELGSQSDTESRIYIKKGKLRRRGKSNNGRISGGRSGNSAVESTASSTIIEEKSNFKKKGANTTTRSGSQNSQFKKKSSNSYSRSKSRSKYCSGSRSRSKSRQIPRSRSCSSTRSSSSQSSSSYIECDSYSDSSSGSRINFNRNSKIKLKKLIRDYSNLYAEYIVTKNLSKIKTYY